MTEMVYARLNRILQTSSVRESDDHLKAKVKSALTKTNKKFETHILGTNLRI